MHIEECEDDGTAATEALTELEDNGSDSDEDSCPDDFAAENDPRPPPSEMMYGGQGKNNGVACTNATATPNAQSAKKAGRW